MYAILRRMESGWLFRWRSYLPLLLVPPIFLSLPEAARLEIRLGDPLMDLWEGACIGLVLIGVALRGLVVGHSPSGTSGRETSRQRAATLNMTGLYSVTRNPLYLANALIYLAIAMYAGVWWTAALAVLACVLFYRRLIPHEEAFLSARFGETYRAWAESTPRFWPDFGLWLPWTTRFSWRKLLRREYPGWFGAILILALVDIAEDSVDAGRLEGDPAWIVAVGVAAVLYGIARALKKRGYLRARPIDNDLPTYQPESP